MEVNKEQYYKKDNPLTLLSKPSYKTVVLKLRANYLNLMFGACCYTEQSSAKLYKWIPHDKKNIYEGQSGKRILKMKESSSLPMRCFTPSCCKGYEE